MRRACWRFLWTGIFKTIGMAKYTVNVKEKSTLKGDMYRSDVKPKTA
jgi:hypothetical protein